MRSFYLLPLLSSLGLTTPRVQAQTPIGDSALLASQTANPQGWHGFSLGATVSAYGNLCDTYRLGVIQSARRKELKASLFNFDVLLGYQTPSGWRFETGHGFGASGIVGVDAVRSVGRSSTWLFPLARVPLRIYRRQALGTSRFAVAPMGGLLYTFWWPTMRGSTYDNTQLRAPLRPEIGSVRLQFYDLGRYHSLSYELGTELSYLLNKETVFTLRAHYTNTFSPDYVARMILSYDDYGVSQPAYVSQSKLEAWVLAAGVQFRLARSPESRRH
jgi:hypothetical protein